MRRVQISTRQVEVSCIVSMVSCSPIEDIRFKMLSFCSTVKPDKNHSIRSLPLSIEYNVTVNIKSLNSVAENSWTDYNKRFKKNINKVFKNKT